MAKVGDKFLIEIGEVYETLENGASVNDEQIGKPTFLYRIKGFNSLVFDEDGLSRLQQVNIETAQELAYLRGLDDVWECARKIQLLSGDERYKIFGSESPIVDLGVRYCMAKIKAYEEQKKTEEEIEIGDEIIHRSARVVVTYINSYDDEWNGFAINDCDNCKPGQVYICMQGFKNWKKTGRHFQQIADVLKQLQEGEE